MILVFFVFGLNLSLRLNAQNRTVGLVKYKTENTPGYCLFSPMNSKQTFLIDKCGLVVKKWNHDYYPGLSVSLFPDGSLLRCGTIMNFNFGLGVGGILQKYSWDSTLLWEYKISDTTQALHHDAKILPNGNILAIIWEKKTAAEAIAEGKDPAYATSTVWNEHIVEIKPIGSNDIDIVWEWSAWDHIIQDFDNKKPNYGVVKDHPELFDINHFETADNGQDWFHFNSIDYNSDLNQIILTAHSLNEFYIIDHSTNSFQAASHSGGMRGKGGDVLYRWGNPKTYGRGFPADQKLYKPHHAHWIKNGYTDSGSIMVFNNGWGRPGGNYSTVDVVTPPSMGPGNYVQSSTLAFGPASQKIAYKAPNATDFYSQIISGVYSLRNDGLLITEGIKGTIFETNSKDSIVWKYINPITSAGLKSQGETLLNPSNNSVFRAQYYEPDFEGFKGKILKPTVEIESNPYNKTLCQVAGNEVIKTVFGMSVAPQPFHDILTMRGKAESMRIFNTAGAELFHGVFAAQTDLSFLNDGIYILQLIQDGNIQTIRIMKN